MLAPLIRLMSRYRSTFATFSPQAGRRKKCASGDVYILLPVYGEKVASAASRMRGFA